MGGPRASTERMMARGEKCARCMRYLGSPPLRLCEGCDPAASSPRKPAASDQVTGVFLRAEHYGGVWYCDYFEKDLATRIGRRRIVRSEDRLRDMIQRTAQNKTRAGLRILDHDIELGKVDVWLVLTNEQYEALLR